MHETSLNYDFACVIPQKGLSVSLVQYVLLRAYRCSDTRQSAMTIGGTVLWRYTGAHPYDGRHRQGNARAPRVRLFFVKAQCCCLLHHLVTFQYQVFLGAMAKAGSRYRGNAVFQVKNFPDNPSKSGVFDA